jgi:hypothetical protein
MQREIGFATGTVPQNWDEEPSSVSMTELQDPDLKPSASPIKKTDS